MTEMNGGQAIVRTLKQYGVDTVFGLPGVQLDPIFDAFYDERESISVLHTRHEQAAAYMAFGYAQSTGKVGVCLVVPGPGLLNTTAALSTAYAVNAPVLCLSGQIPANSIDKGFGLLHEIPNPLDMIRSVTKWAARIDHPSDVPSLMREAFKQLRTNRPRPVELEMAMDIMNSRGEVELLAPPASYPSPDPDPELIEKAARLLAKAINPMIFVGGGIFGSEEELLRLAETLQAPVVMSSSGRGAVSDRNYLAHTIVSGRDMVSGADVVLAVGTRFFYPQRVWGINSSPVKIVRVDIDPEEIARYSEPAVGIVSDAKKALGQLIRRIEHHTGPRKSREAELMAVKERAAEVLLQFQPQASFARVIREELPEDGILVNEMTQVGYFANVGFPFYKPRTFITPGYQGTLGFGFATALGVQVGNPDRKVISINGDGGFMYNVQELSTAVQHKIPVVTIVFNDDAFGNVKRYQREKFDGRMIACDLSNPDFMKLADSFGVAGLRAKTPEDLRVAIREGFDSNHPTVIEVPVGEMPSIWPFMFSRPLPYS